jgi:hypothetical protein
MKIKCMVCGSNTLTVILNIPDQPLSRYGLVQSKNYPVKKYPIKIVRCGTCTHIQNNGYLEGTVDYTDEEIKESRTYSERMKLFLDKDIF